MKPSEDELRDLLDLQVRKFRGERLPCAFCVWDEAHPDFDSWEDEVKCSACPFPGDGHERCIREAIPKGDIHTDNEIPSGLESERRAFWAEWYQAWRDDPDLTPPPLEWREP